MVNDKLKKIKNSLSLCIKGHSDQRAYEIVCPWATCKLVKTFGSYLGFVYCWQVVRGIRTLYFTPGLYI